MAGHLDAAPFPHQLSIRADQERGPFDSADLLAVHVVHVEGLAIGRGSDTKTVRAQALIHHPESRRTPVPSFGMAHVRHDEHRLDFAACRRLTHVTGTEAKKPNPLRPPTTPSPRLPGRVKP
jgi:hypothetical protein